MVIQQLPERKFCDFFGLFDLQNLNVTVTSGRSVQFSAPCHASPEHSVEIVQYDMNTKISYCIHICIIFSSEGSYRIFILLYHIQLVEYEYILDIL